MTLAAGSFLISPFRASQWRVLPFSKDMFAKVQEALEMWPCSISATGFFSALDAFEEINHVAADNRDGMCLNKVRSAAALGADFNDPVVFPRSSKHRCGLGDINSGGLLHIHMVTGFHCLYHGQGVPVIRCAD